VISPRWVLNGLDLTAPPYAVVKHSADPGSPEPVSNVLASMLADGDIVLKERDGNRTYQMTVLVDGSDLAESATALANLDAVVKVKRGTLVCEPGDEIAPTSVFETFEGESVVVPDEDYDAAGLRLVELSIPAGPFARPEEQVEIEAPPLPPAGEVVADVPITDGSSTAGFTATDTNGTGGSTLTVGANVAPFTGMVYGSDHAVTGGSTGIPTLPPAIRLTRTGALPVDPDRPYIEVSGVARYRLNSGAWQYGLAVNPTIVGGGAPLSMTSGANGAFSLLIAQTAEITSLAFDTVGSNSAPTSDIQIGVSITRTAGPQDGVFTGRFQSRQVEILGSQRTELSLSVLGLDADDSATGLGEQALVYTAAAGADSRLKIVSCRAAASLEGTPDPTTVSGTFNAIGSTGTPTSFAMSGASLLPGSAVLYARLRPTDNTNHTISYRVRVSDGTVTSTGPWRTWPLVIGSAWPQIPNDTWRIVALGMTDLMADVIDGGTVTVDLAVNAGTVRVDDVWTAHTVGQVSLLDTSKSGGSLSLVELNAATVTQEFPAAYVGEVGGVRIDAARTGRSQIFDQHQAAPGLLQIATITPGCATSRVSARYYPRYHTHVAPLEV